MASRKMRRSRDAAGSGGGGGSSGGGSSNNANEETTSLLLSGFDVYNLQGDAAAACDIFFSSTREGGDESNSRLAQEVVGATGAQAPTAPSMMSSAPSSSPLQHPTLANRYNRLLLSSLVSQSSGSSSTGANSLEDLLEKMNLMEEEFQNKRQKEEEAKVSILSPLKLQRNELILAYNRALVLFTTGNHDETVRILTQVERQFLPEMMQKREKPPQELAIVSSRMAFLLLECNLARTVGRTYLGSNNNNNHHSSLSSSPALSSRIILEWLERFDTEKDPQFKFLLNLYRSRVDLAVLEEQTGKHDDARIRSARKELKQAMDVFQHKLRPIFGADTGGGGAGSVVSSANSEENTTYSNSNNLNNSNNNNNNPYDPQQQTPSSIVLQRHNQSALSLKAHSEQLKGNTKKSLILCSEAYTACVDSSPAAGNGGPLYYDTLHANNLAVVYETIGKRHLALHALSKSLRNAAAVNAAATSYNNETHDKEEKDSTASTANTDLPSSVTNRTPLMFSADGTAKPDVTLLVLHNAAICALQARHYVTAYECMATCIAKAPAIFGNRPRCWLRLAEACVGIFYTTCELGKNSNNNNSNNNKKFTPIEVNGEPKGIIVDNAWFTDHPDLNNEELAPTLGSPEDLEQVQRNPLVRARASLEHVLSHFEGTSLGIEALTSARLMLAYVHLAFGEYDQALEMAELVLDNHDVAAKHPPPSSSSTAMSDDEVSRRCHQRWMATARMYAAEACCALGDTTNAMKFLVGDGQEDAFDRLASDLSGVTIETASSNGKGKRRLARAQTVVRSSASVVTAAMGNLTASKQLAMSAQAMEDAYYAAPLASSSTANATAASVANRERSCARRALAYTLLKGGHHGAALSLLRSLR